MEILSVSDNSGIWVLMIPILVVTGLLFACFVDGKDKNSKFQMITCLLFTVVFFVATTLGIVNESQKKILKVKITNMDEIDFEKYEITNNEGKIIELTER